MRSSSAEAAPTRVTTAIRAYVVPLVALPSALGLTPGALRQVAPAPEVAVLGRAFSDLGRSLDMRLMRQALTLPAPTATDDFMDVTLARTPSRVRHLKGTLIRRPRPLGVSETPDELAAYLDAPDV